MAPKSDEVETAEGATTKPETTEFMDLSTESGFFTPRKRKAEILATANEDEEEDEDDEKEEEKEKEEAVDSCESDQEWDVDSFKDEDFHSSDVSDDEDWRRYVRQCYKSEDFVRLILMNFFKAPYLTGREYMETLLKVVIEKYNEDKKKNLVLDHIVRAVVKKLSLTTDVGLSIINNPRFDFAVFPATKV